MLQMAGRMSALGTETAFEVLARANALAAQGRSIINLGIGQPDFPTPEHIVEAGRKALADGHHGYTAGQRHPRAARGGGGRPLPPAPGRGLARPRARRPGRQGHDVLRDPDVRRTRGRDPLSEPELPDLRERDPVFRRHTGADPAPRKCRLLVQRRGGARQDHPAHPSLDHQQPGQPDRRGRAAARARPARRRARAPPAGRRAQRRNLRRDPL